MPRGFPDYANPSYVAATKMFDLEGVFASGFGVSTQDARGRIVWLDNFSQGLSAWRLSTAGTGVVAGASSVRAEIPPASFSYTGGPVAGGGSATIDRQTTWLEPGRIGHEFSVYYSECDIVLSCLFQLVKDSIQQSYYFILYMFDGVLELYGDPSARFVTTLVPPYDGGTWLPCKVVADYTTGYLVRFMLGSLHFDLTSYPLSTGAYAPGDYIYTRLALGGVSPSPGTSHIGHVILTTDEP